MPVPLHHLVRHSDRLQVQLFHHKLLHLFSPAPKSSHRPHSAAHLPNSNPSPRPLQSLQIPLRFLIIQRKLHPVSSRNSVLPVRPSDAREVLLLKSQLPEDSSCLLQPFSYQANCPLKCQRSCSVLNIVRSGAEMHVSAVFGALLGERFHHCHKVVVYLLLYLEDTREFHFSRSLLNLIHRFLWYAPKFSMGFGKRNLDFQPGLQPRLFVKNSIHFRSVTGFKWRDSHIYQPTQGVLGLTFLIPYFRTPTTKIMTEAVFICIRCGCRDLNP